MAFGGRHKEDIKAVLRRRYGSVTAFEEAKGLPSASVSDVLRGRTATRTIAAINEELAKPNPSDAREGACPLESDFSDDSTLGRTSSNRADSPNPGHTAPSEVAK